MLLSIEILYEELLQTGRLKDPFWGLLQATVTVQLGELPASEFQPVADIRIGDSAPIHLWVRDGAPWLRIPTQLGDRDGERDGLEQVLHQKLLDYGLARPHAEMEVMSKRKRRGRPKFVPDPTLLHGNRIELIRAVAQHWSDTNLALVEGMVVERGRFSPPSDAGGANPVIVPATFPEWPIELTSGNCIIGDAEVFRACRNHVAYALKKDRPGPQGRPSLQRMFAQAMIDDMHRSGTIDVEANLQEIENASRPLATNPPIWLDDIDYPEPTYVLCLPFPQHTPGERLSPTVFADDEEDGYYAEDVLIPVIPDDAMVVAANMIDWHADFKISLHDGSYFFARSKVFEEDKDWRTQALDPDSDIDETFSDAADWLVENANDIGPRHPGHRCWSPKAYGEAIKYTPWEPGAPPSIKAVEEMAVEFAARRMVQTETCGILYRSPEPVLRIDCRAGGKPSLDTCFSWRRHVAGIPMRGSPAPFLFPLTAYVEARDFLQVFGRRAEKVCDAPEVLEPAVFSANFDAWNLKAAMFHILDGADGRLCLLQQEVLDAGIRVSRHLDLWCVDATTADASQREDFAYDCLLLVDSLMDPQAGWVAPPPLLDFAYGLAERFAPPSLDMVAEGSDPIAESEIYSM